MLKEITVKRIEEPEFAEMRVAWNGILENSCTNEVFLLWEWIHAWWNVFRKPNRELFILAGIDNQGQLIGLAPFYRENVSILGIRYGKILKICGDPETYPDHLDLFCRRDWEEIFVKAIFRYLKEQEGDWDCLDLRGLAESSTLRKMWIQGSSSWIGLLWDWRSETNSPYLETTGSFREYLNSFSRKKRYNLLRTRKLLSEQKDLETRELTAPQEIEKYYETLVSLHAERAKRKGIRSTFTKENVGVFHKTLIQALLNKEKVAFTILYKKKTPLAASYCLHHNRKCYYYQSGISAEGEKCSAGLVLLSWMVEKCFNEGFLEFDFLQGSEEYKKYWTNKSRKSLSLEVDKGKGDWKLARMIYDYQKKITMARWKIRNILEAGRRG